MKMTRQIVLILIVIANVFAKENQMPLPQKWNLDKIFTEKTIEPYFAKLESDLDLLETLTDDLEEAILLSSDIRERLRHVAGYAECLSAENTLNKTAPLYVAKVQELSARYETASLSIDAILAALSNPEFENLLTSEALAPLTYYLEERRTMHKEKLSTNEERIITLLGTTGFQGYETLYGTLCGDCRFPFQGKEYSLGQIKNKISSTDYDTRHEAFDSIENVFKKKENLFAQILNNLGGFRVQTYNMRGWDSVVKEAVDVYRMDEKTLDAMWEAVEEIKPLLVQYLEKKAELLGLEKLGFCDVPAPIHKNENKIPYDKAAEMILTQFNKFLPSFAKFSARALESGWIEAENRNHKRQGGFCLDLPITKESRIFMTYDGSLSNVETLAHELGHAYHNEVLYDLPPLNREIRENVAETASTMAEMIVADAALQEAKTPEERLVILDDKISRATAFCMNIRARFQFEKQFYEARKKGYVTPEKLNELMVAVQKEAYGDALSEYAPHYWGNTLHFYITEIPFYNFPYTFGYLFSLGIYTHGKKNPENFEKMYIDLLRDTATMNVEDLAEKHLGIDLRKPDFWRAALKEVAKDCEEFLTCSQ